MAVYPWDVALLLLCVAASPVAMSAAALQVRKRIECRTRDLHQSLLVKLAHAMARAHGKAGTGSQAPATDLQGPPEHVCTPVPDLHVSCALCTPLSFQQLTKPCTRSSCCCPRRLNTLQAAAQADVQSAVADNDCEGCPCNFSVMPCALTVSRSTTFPAWTPVCRFRRSPLAARVLACRRCSTRQCAAAVGASRADW